ncbi:MAG: response regulator transcription factor [Turicibacter sp.]|nr:response regulator transcription factor [Turicibacter sp.]
MAETKEHILVVEDDQDIAFAVREYLLSQGYTVSLAENGKVALEMVADAPVDLAIVDVMMPVMDGITFVMNVRKEHDFPVIMLSAKSEETDKILGLNMGADDYVTKPFRPLELLARVNSQLRRQRRQSERSGNQVTEEKNLIIVGGLEMDTATRVFKVDGEAVRLTPLEYKILNLLMANAGRVFSADEIYERVWNEVAVNTDTIMVHVRKIREKIEIDPKNPQYLKVVWGVGYRIDAPGKR